MIRPLIRGNYRRKMQDLVTNSVKFCGENLTLPTDGEHCSKVGGQEISPNLTNLSQSLQDSDTTDLESDDENNILRYRVFH